MPSMLSSYAQKLQTVSELTSSIKGLLEIQFSFVTVVGEISNLRNPHSGHLYFTLKDQAAQIKAVMFKMQQRYLALVPEDGMEAVCRGRIAVYEPRGEYQIIVDSMEFRGTGNLQIAFDNLKKKLEQQGLFDAAHKKTLPAFPTHITVITSPQGAAVFDFLKVAQTRCPSIAIDIYPVRVQGEGAADEIVEALHAVNELHRTDAIVLCRGGGSIEDLWSFNDEKVANALFDSDIPVVSAIGHEIDFTIADFVADVRAPTPSAAAEIIIPDKKMLRAKIHHCTRRLTNVTGRMLDSYSHRTITVQNSLASFSSTITHNLLVVDNAETNLVHAFEKNFANKRRELENLFHTLENQNPARRLQYQKELLTKTTMQFTAMMQVHVHRKEAELRKNALLLDAVSPLAILGRGYSIVKSEKNGEVIRNSKQVQTGDDLEVKLHNGLLGCKVTDVKNNQ